MQKAPGVGRGRKVSDLGGAKRSRARSGFCCGFVDVQVPQWPFMQIEDTEKIQRTSLLVLGRHWTESDRRHRRERHRRHGPTCVDLQRRQGLNLACGLCWWGREADRWGREADCLRSWGKCHRRQRPTCVDLHRSQGLDLACCLCWRWREADRWRWEADCLRSWRERHRSQRPTCVDSHRRQGMNGRPLVRRPAHALL